MANVETRLAALERRMARMLMTGTIVAADYEAARVKVKINERESHWLPWATRRAGGDVDWWPPEIGEQVDVLCPNGELPGARVYPAFYSDQVPAPANTPDVRIIQFANGTTIKHDRAENELVVSTPGTVNVQADGDMNFKAAGNILIQGSEVDINP